MADAHIQALERQKAELIAKAKALDERLAYKTLEARALREAMKSERTRPPGVLRKRLEELEWRIATESLSLKSERAFMKAIGETKKELAAALEFDRKRKKLAYVEGDVRLAELERRKVEEDIQRVKKEIDAAWAAKRAGEKRAREAAIAAWAPEGGGEGVSLGEIAVIKKKGE
ncbi:MAG: hypothetical protein QXH27_04470 [Candidatus Micrarchaeia archaeon]